MTDRIKIKPSDNQSPFIQQAIEEWRAIVEQSDLQLPEILLIEESRNLDQDQVWSYICNQITDSSLSDSNDIADYLKNNQLDKFIHGHIAQVLVTGTDESGAHNNSAVVLYSNKQMRFLDPDMIKLIMFHELQHTICMGVDPLKSNIDHEFKADVFAMLAACNRIDSVTMEKWWLNLVRSTNPLTGRMQAISHDLQTGITVYPIAYIYPFIEPLLLAVLETTEPLGLTECLALTHQIYNIFENQALNEKFKQTVKMIAVDHLWVKFDKQKALECISESNDLDSVYKWTLACYLQDGDQSVQFGKFLTDDSEWILNVQKDIKIIVENIKLSHQNEYSFKI